MIACPVCLSKEKTQAFKVPGAIVSKCSKCSHAFSHDLQVTPEEVYSENYFQEQHKNWFKHPNYSLFKKIANSCLQKSGNKKISILDVGCGNGDFLRYLSAQGFTNLTGVDFIQNNHDSIKFVQANIFELSEKTFGQKFDVIVTLATIEHVEDVRQFIGILTSLAKPGGIISIMTLDENSFIYRIAKLAKKLGIDHGVNRLYDKHHLNHFSKKSLSMLLQKNESSEIFDHYGINFPVKAIDLPKSFLNLIIKPSIILIFFITSLFKRMEFLQVISAKVR